MNWHYAEGQERRGPVPDAQMFALIAAGTVKPDTLVWTPGFPQWKPARETLLFAGTAGSAPDAGAPVLQTSVLAPPATGAVNARRDGNRIVVPVAGARLPLRCVKTNTVVSESEVVNRKLYWCTPWAALSILLSLIVYIILYLVLRKPVQLDIPLSPAGRGIIRKQALIGWATVFGGIALIVVAAVNSDLIALILLGILLVLGGLIYVSVKASALRVTKIKEGEAWLGGAGPEFLATLPPYA